MTTEKDTTSVLIPLHNHIFEQKTKPGVSARTLYQFLELNPAAWARWVKRNIISNPYAIEHVDWESFQPPVENRIDPHRGGRPAHDYALSIDFSKRLAMMARSAKGEEARAYFLECERKVQAPQVPELHDPAYQLLVQTVIDLDTTKHQVALLVERERIRDQELIATQQKIIEGFLLAEQAHTKAEEAEAKAEQAEASAERAHDARDFFTVAEYMQYEYSEQKIPRREYKAISDHLQAYCMNKGKAFRRQPVGGKPWSEEFAYHRSIYDAALPGWLHRRYAQDTLRVIYPQDRGPEGAS